MALFDLAEGDPSARPRAEHGFAACEVASSGPFPTGRVGAGTGATVDKWRGVAHRRPGGLGTATRRDGDLVVSALVAVNAFGAIDDGADHPWPAPDAGAGAGSATAFEHTTIGVIATNAALDKVGCSLVAQSGHDGLARALLPVHTQADGDALVAVATGPVQAEVDHVRLLAVRCVEAAVRSVRP
jgi:L-aminopeptidase/D-esterase-like protein